MPSKKHQSTIESNSAFMVKMEDLVKEIIIQNNIPYYRIESRMDHNANSEESGYLPIVRVITYFEDSVSKISEIICGEFDVTNERSKDKKKIRLDSFSYKHIQFMASLKPARQELIEYRRSGNKTFEIQVCSMLQDAWAGIERELGYDNATFPDEMKRDFYRVGALLEMADLEFLKIRSQLSSKYGWVEQPMDTQSEEAEYVLPAPAAYVPPPPPAPRPAPQPVQSIINNYIPEVVAQPAPQPQFIPQPIPVQQMPAQPIMAPVQPSYVPSQPEPVAVAPVQPVYAPQPAPVPVQPVAPQPQQVAYVAPVQNIQPIVEQYIPQPIPAPTPQPAPYSVPVQNIQPIVEQYIPQPIPAPQPTPAPQPAPQTAPVAFVAPEVHIPQAAPVQNFVAPIVEEIKAPIIEQVMPVVNTFIPEPIAPPVVEVPVAKVAEVVNVMPLTLPVTPVSEPAHNNATNTPAGASDSAADDESVPFYEREPKPVKTNVLDENAQMTDATLKQYVSNSKLVKEVDSEVARRAGATLNNDVDIEGDVERLKYLKVYSLKQLHERITDNKNDIIAFAEKWIGKDNGGSFDSGICLFYLEYLLVGKKNDPAFAVEYVLKFISDNDYSARFIIPTYNSISKGDQPIAAHLTLK